MKTNNIEVSENLNTNLQLLHSQYFKEADDFYIRNGEESNFAVVYLHTLVDQTILDRDILSVLSETALTPEKLYCLLKQSAIPVGKISKSPTWIKVAQALVQGDVVILIQGIQYAVVAPCLESPSSFD